MELKENESREEVFSLSFFLSLLCVCVFLFFKTVHTLEKKRKKRKTQRLHPQMQTNPFSWSFFPVALFFFESWLGFFVSSKTTVGGDLLFFSLCDARTQAHAQFAFLCEEREKKMGGKRPQNENRNFTRLSLFVERKMEEAAKRGVQNMKSTLSWFKTSMRPFFVSGCLSFGSRVLASLSIFSFFFDQKSVGVSECE